MIPRSRLIFVNSIAAGTLEGNALTFPRFFSILTRIFRCMPTNSTPIPAVVTPRSLDEAFAYCAAITSRHYENFPVASLFLPEEKRPYIQAIYAFSRIADDFADEPGRDASDRIQNLDAWEQQLVDCYAGNAVHPVFIALRETIHRLNIPLEPLRDLLSAFRQDVVKERYETFAEVMDYCRRSANPIGRLVLLTFGYHDDRLFELSDSICTGLQLANFWQDVAVDCERGRVYLPAEDQHRFDCAIVPGGTIDVDDRFRALMKFEVDRTRNLFEHGAALPSHVDKDLELELKLVWFGGMAILRKLDRSKYDIVRRRPRLNAFDKLLILGKGLFVGDLTQIGQKVKIWDRT